MESPLDIRSLRYFLAVVDEGSFGSGARRAGVSQPAVSQTIAQLEEELSARLFDRGGRRVALTPDGEAFVDSARRVVAEFDELPARLDRAIDASGERRPDMMSIDAVAEDGTPDRAARCLELGHERVRHAPEGGLMGVGRREIG